MDLSVVALLRKARASYQNPFILLQLHLSHSHKTKRFSSHRANLTTETDPNIIVIKPWQTLFSASSRRMPTTSRAI